MTNDQARRNALIRAYQNHNNARVLRLGKKLWGKRNNMTIGQMACAAGLLHHLKGEWK
jgi:hypothetical protein